MKKFTLLIITLIVIISCKNNSDCPDCPNCPPCPDNHNCFVCAAEVDRLLLIIDSLQTTPPDPAIVCPACLNAFEAYTVHYWDSVESEKEHYIDSLRAAALLDIDKVRADFEKWADSTKNVRISGNMIIRKDSLQRAARAEFDTATGLPVLIFGPVSGTPIPDPETQQ